jgi:hypothetical protein
MNEIRPLSVNCQVDNQGTTLWKSGILASIAHPAHIPPKVAQLVQPVASYTWQLHLETTSLMA